MAIVYLDVDDEITSAASRIRRSEDTAIGLVLPAGSRLGTSRINFRLLAHEARVNARNIGIVSPEASTRALAASAGLPVFASVFEYEAARAAPAPASGPGAQSKPVPERGPTPPSESTVTGAPETAAPAGLPAGAAAVVAGGLGGPGPVAAESGSPPPVAAPSGTPPVAAPVFTVRPAIPVVGGAGRRGVPRTGLLVGVAIIALGALVVAVAGFLFLPSATIDLVVRPERLGPVDLVVTADPAATATDPRAAIVPAQRPMFELSASGTFPATGKRVVNVRASGRVTFDSINTVGPVSVPRGTRLSTLPGEVFATTASVIVPQARVAGEKISHGVASVDVQAVAAGPDGNVDAGSITQVPGFLQVQQVSVSNGAPTTGGVHEEFARVSQKDVDAALEQLTRELDNQLSAALRDPATVPAGRAVFEDTASRTDPVPSVDPATLLDQEIESFELGLTATGSVTAVDIDAVRALAEQRLRETIPPGDELVGDSVQVDLGEPAVSGEAITFPVTAGAFVVPPVDAKQVRLAVSGRPVDEARRTLAEYGDATITVWPGWVSSIPTYDFRVEVTVRTETPAAGGPGGVSPAPLPEGSSGATPSASESP